MAAGDTRSDEELLAAAPRDADAFATFYRRHLPAVLHFFKSRLRQSDLAADLAAETFAAALIAAPRYKRELAPPTAWLYAIARHKLFDSLRRGQVEDEARRRLGTQPVELYDDDLARVDEMAAAAAAGGAAIELLGSLPDETRTAVEARVLGDKDYAEIARDMRCSEQVVRKRVSRGLSQLRRKLEDEEGES